MSVVSGQWSVVSMDDSRFNPMGLIYMLNTCPTAIDFDVYRPRNPKASAYYRCVEDHFEQLETVWDDRYQGRFGFWRPYVTNVIFHPYLHVLATDGCFYNDAAFMVCPPT